MSAVINKYDTKKDTDFKYHLVVKPISALSKALANSSKRRVTYLKKEIQQQEV